MGEVFPITTSSPLTRVPGGAMPSSSSLSYVPCRSPAVTSRLGRSIASCTMLPCRFSSALYDRKKMDRKMPRSMLLWFIIVESS